MKNSLMFVNLRSGKGICTNMPIIFNFCTNQCAIVIVAFTEERKVINYSDVLSIVSYNSFIESQN